MAGSADDEETKDEVVTSVFEQPALPSETASIEEAGLISEAADHFDSETSIPQRFVIKSKDLNFSNLNLKFLVFKKGMTFFYMNFIFFSFTNGGHHHIEEEQVVDDTAGHFTTEVKDANQPHLDSEVVAPGATVLIFNYC